MNCTTPLPFAGTYPQLVVCTREQYRHVITQYEADAVAQGAQVLHFDEHGLRFAAAAYYNHGSCLYFVLPALT